MPERVRQTRWKTADGRFFDAREPAVSHEKVLSLGEAIRRAIYEKHTERPSADWCQDVADWVLANAKQHGLIIALAYTSSKEPPT